MSRLGRILGAVLVAFSLVASFAPQQSQAALPPAGYPSSTMISVTMNPRPGVGAPLRRGFYDADQDAGFGWDKLWNKHNIWDSNAVKVLGAPPSVWQGRRVWLSRGGSSQTRVAHMAAHGGEPSFTSSGKRFARTVGRGLRAPGIVRTPAR